MIKMDKLLVRILGILLGLYSPLALAMNLPADDLESYYKHVMFHLNEEFESMLDNWAAQYIGPNNNPPVICSTPNQTDENGDLLACVQQTTNNENTNANTVLNNENTNANIVLNNENSNANTALNNENTNANTALNNENTNDNTVLNNVMNDQPEVFEPIQVNNTIITNLYQQLKWFIRDPFQLPDKVKVKHLPNLIVLYASTRNVSLAGISNFELTDVNVNTTANTLMNKFKWEFINVTGEYELDISGPRVHLYGNGPFSINISSIAFGFNINLGQNENKTIRLDSCDVDLNIGNVSMRLGNFLDGSAAGETANNFLSEILPQALDLAMPKFKRIIEKKFMDHFNNIFVNLYPQNVTNFVHTFLGIK